ncbi:MAG: InlB B-repeat-containing protein [Microthrixaceae bacterium]
MSDDFSGGVGSQWSVVDPLGDGSVSAVGLGTSDARLALSVPAGVNHDPYVPNDALRVVQPVSDEDFEVVVKFDSVPGVAYQQQGIVVEADGQSWLRFDVHRNPQGLRAYTAKVVNGSWTSLGNRSASAGSSVWLRVSRSGDSWTYATSADGVSFVNQAVFSQALGVTGVGVYSGNFGIVSAPAYTALVDYVFNTASPIDPEDPTGEPVALGTSVVGQGSVQRSPDAGSYPVGSQVSLTAVADPGWSFDGWSGDVSSVDNPVSVTMDEPKDVVATFVTDSSPPVISGVSVDAADTTAVVSWQTDEPASSRVEFGTSPALGSPAVSDAALVSVHNTTLNGLVPDTTYYYRVVSTDASGNTSTTGIDTFTTTTTPIGPLLDLWYDDDLQVGGSVPIAQRFTDIQGNVSDPSGIASLTASLNNGVPRPISVGANGRRLVADGDFVVDVLNAELNAGVNSVLIEALSNAGQSTSRTVTISYTPGSAPLVATTIDWSSAPVESLASVVDGDWAQAPGGVRTARPGYDRLLAVGDVTWSDYEVTVPITINSYVSPTGPNSGAPAVGMLMRWNGHNNTLGAPQPFEGYVPDGVNPTPLGAYPVLRGNQLQLRNHLALVAERQYFPFSIGVTYMMKNRAETQLDGSTLYSTKVWQQGQPEPATFNLSFLAGNDDHQPATGSLVLLAHEADVTFGNVTILPVP